MIRFYLAGALDPSLVDLHLMPDGKLVPNMASQNVTFTTNITLHLDPIGITPEQLDIIRAFAKTSEVVISFAPN